MKLTMQKGCLFHFGQSISKKFKELGFQNLYAADLEVNHFFRSIFILALIPVPDIDQF